VIWSTNLGGSGISLPARDRRTVVLDSATIGFETALARLRPGNAAQNVAVDEPDAVLPDTASIPPSQANLG
jgi:hypothetical protein